MIFSYLDSMLSDGLLAMVPMLTYIPLLSRILLYIASTIVFSLIVSKLLFMTKHKGKIPGPSFVVPIVGGIVDMMRNPFCFWERQRMYNPGGVSWNSLLGKFMLFSANPNLTHKIFTINSSDTMTCALHPNARLLLGDHNIAFITGTEHKDLRKSFLHLFNSKALGIYLHMQERVIQKHINQWLENHPIGSKPVEMRELLRKLSAETSQHVFVGPYLSNPEQFSSDYLTLTQGFLSAPIYFPGTGLYKAAKARDRIIIELTKAVKEAKEYIAKDGAPRCLVDFWAAEILRECQEADSEGRPHPIHADDDRMANTMMDFLFASQDATTAGTAWIIANITDHPELLEKVREEQRTLRPTYEPINHDMLMEMTYARQFILECLRYRPPAPMMPMLTHKDLNLEGVEVPSGSYVMASIWSSCMEGFPNPHTFDPDRMSAERHEDRTYQKEFIPFGAGPHRCVGYTYAINHLTLFLVVMSSIQCVRESRPDNNAVIYYPTLYPKHLLCTFAPKTR